MINLSNTAEQFVDCNCRLNAHFEHYSINVIHPNCCSFALTAEYIEHHRNLKTCRSPYSGLDVSIHVNKSLTSHETGPLHCQNTYQLTLSDGMRTTYGQVLDPTAFLCHHREQAA